eukprot:184871-Pyramimonas_sp.AAC.1
MGNPLVSYDEPTPLQTQLPTARTFQPNERCWRALFDLTQEVQADIPTHFSRSQYAASAIDRAFRTEHFLLDADALLNVDSDPLELAQGGLRDHPMALLNLKFQGARRRRGPSHSRCSVQRRKV